jgi:hypothetical protein
MCEWEWLPVYRLMHLLNIVKKLGILKFNMQNRKFINPSRDNAIEKKPLQELTIHLRLADFHNSWCKSDVMISVCSDFMTNPLQLKVFKTAFLISFFLELPTWLVLLVKNDAWQK